MPRMTRSGRHAPAHRVLFPLACLQAALAVPLWSARWLGWLPGGDPVGHAHQMLTGFALAVVAGFLLTRLSRAGLVAVSALWGLARVADAAGLPMAAAADAGFVALLAVIGGLPFLRSARSGHNLVFFPILAGFLAAEGLTLAGRMGWLADGGTRGVGLTLDLVTLLVLVMGGRILPAAMAGAVRAQGGRLDDRNQPGLERIGILGMAVAAAAHLASLPDLAALGWAAAGLSGLARLSRWRLSAALADPSLWPLHLGFAWLGGGLLASAAATWSGLWPTADCLHAVTVGGIGTMTAAMMVRTTRLRDRAAGRFPRAATIAVTALTAAAVARLLSPLAPIAFIPVSAALWSGAFVLIGATLLVHGHD